jgi:uncharacterized protein (UPF0335 family)
MENDKIKSFAEQLSKAHDELNLCKLHIKDIYDAAADAGFDKPALKDALKDYLMTPDQLAKKRQREEIADMYRAQLKLI